MRVPAPRAARRPRSPRCPRSKALLDDVLAQMRAEPDSFTPWCRVELQRRSDLLPKLPLPSVDRE